MTRKSLFGRFTRPTSAARVASRPAYFQGRLELLEDRRLLSGENLLIGQYEPSGGKSVLRYDQSFAPTSGTVPYLDHGLSTSAGLAVAPDGSFYVSSDDFVTFQGKVLHYSNSGAYLDTLGQSDGVAAPIVVPGALAFGPNGRLYVADLGSSAVFQFDTSSNTQQWQAGATNWLAYTPGGIAFAADANLDNTHDLIVGGLDTSEVTRYHEDNTTETLVANTYGVNPSAIVVQPNGDMFIADLALATHATDHHRIMFYNASAAPGSRVSQLVNLTTPVGTGASAGDLPQPTSLLLDHDGNLLIGLSPDHNGNGAVEKYNVTTHALTTLISNIGTPTGLAYISPISTVAGRQLFYANSAYDGYSGIPAIAHDEAIAPDKVALLPGAGESTIANVSAYSAGINGIMIDLTAGGNHAAISGHVATDFVFKVSGMFATNSPSTWTQLTGVNLPNVIMRPAGSTTIGGVLANDRLELLWPDNTISCTFLEVIVKSTSDTGLAADDHFFFGSAPGSSGVGDDPDAMFTDATDEIVARNNQESDLSLNHPYNVAKANIYDYNKDDQVDATDQILARNFGNTCGELDMINISAGGPFAPAAGGAAVASALAGSAVGSGSSVGSSWVANRLASLETSNGSTAAYFGQFITTDSTADAASSNASGSEGLLDLDDELLDALVS